MLDHKLYNLVTIPLVTVEVGGVQCLVIHSTIHFYTCSIGHRWAGHKLYNLPVWLYNVASCIIIFVFFVLHLHLNFKKDIEFEVFGFLIIYLTIL